MFGVVITAAGVIVALCAGLDQAKKMTASIDATKDSTNLAIWNSVSQEWLDFDKVFIEHPEYQKFIYGRAPLIDDKCDAQKEICDQKEENRNKSNSIGHFTLDFIDNSLIVGNYINKSDITHLSEWKDFFNEIFSNSPIVCKLLTDEPKGYSCFTAKLAIERCDKKYEKVLNERLQEKICLDAKHE
jgi:hypothetical protein